MIEAIEGKLLKDGGSDSFSAALIQRVLPYIHLFGAQAEDIKGKEEIPWGMKGEIKEGLLSRDDHPD